MQHLDLLVLVYGWQCCQWSFQHLWWSLTLKLGENPCDFLAFGVQVSRFNFQKISSLQWWRLRVFCITCKFWKVRRTKAWWFSLSALFHAFLSSSQETDQNFTDFAQMQRRWPIFQLRLQTRTKNDNCWGLSTVHVIIAVIAPMVFIDLRKLQRADNSLNCTGRGIVWEKLIFSCRYFG